MAAAEFSVKVSGAAVAAVAAKWSALKWPPSPGCRFERHKMAAAGGAGRGDPF